MIPSAVRRPGSKKLAHAAQKGPASPVAHDESGKERESSEEAAAERDSSILQSNPLLDPTRLGASGGAAGSFAVKRRWDDDVVFRHQSRGEPEQKKRFVNDAIRNDFHKKFLHKYMGSTSNYS